MWLRSSQLHIVVNLEGQSQDPRRIAKTGLNAESGSWELGNRGTPYIFNKSPEKRATKIVLKVVLWGESSLVGMHQVAAKETAKRLFFVVSAGGGPRIDQTLNTHVGDTQARITQ